ncbi:MAG: thiamine pyrophosphate-dependent enzyme [Sphaerobacter sp.]|nr:thiamine pyrophosphate-dependent enzyme [Sphaerobacter sp.]
MPRYNRKRASRQEELTALQERIDDRLFEVQPIASYALAIRESIPDDAIVVNEFTQVGYWSSVGFPVYEPRTFLTSGYQGTLGYGFATALGAQVGNPEKRVISINGDGGFMYNVQELSTMAQHNIPVIAIVFNDNAYGNVRLFQKYAFEGRFIATDLHNPDFAKLAELFGVEGRRAEGPEGLRTALREALRTDRPTVIEVPVGEMASPLPLLMQGVTSPPWNWPCE